MRQRKVETAEPAVHPYRQALDRLRRNAKQPGLRERLSELVSLFELATTVGSGPASDERLSAALRAVMRELQAARGALFVRGEDGAFTLWASHGLPAGVPTMLGLSGSRDDVTLVGAGDEAHDRHGLTLLLPVRHGDRTLGLLGLGPREAERTYGTEQQAFLRGVAALLAAPLENRLLRDELRHAHRQLSVKVFELHNLFDLSRDLTGSFAEEAIQKLVVTTVMGHFLVSRCALYLAGPGGLSLAHARGLRSESDSVPIPLEQARAALRAPKAVAELAEGPLRRRLEAARLALAVPLAAGAQLDGVLAIGERSSGLSFSEEDRQVAETLARQALAALENTRLQRVREEKQRQDRELQVAREIQRSLFPRSQPEVPGFELAAESRPCYEVGGDSYDWLPLGDGRLALVVADVAGKGTPASLLMASVHASVQALAGTAAPTQMIERLNRFLFANTQTNRFVTLFYGELDTASRRLSYVNAGHVPPYRIARDGTLGRLREGGPALGLLAEASYEVGEVTLEPGDVVAMVTDGVTEAGAPEEREFGDEGVSAALHRLSGASASAILAGLVAAVDGWTAAAGFGDDLTALILKAR